MEQIYLKLWSELLPMYVLEQEIAKCQASRVEMKSVEAMALVISAEYEKKTVPALREVCREQAFVWKKQLETKVHEATAVSLLSSSFQRVPLKTEDFYMVFDRPQSLKRKGSPVEAQAKKTKLLSMVSLVMFIGGRYKVEYYDLPISPTEPLQELLPGYFRHLGGLQRKNFQMQVRKVDSSRIMHITRTHKNSDGWTIADCNCVPEKDIISVREWRQYSTPADTWKLSDYAPQKELLEWHMRDAEVDPVVLMVVFRPGEDRVYWSAQEIIELRSDAHTADYYTYRDLLEDPRVKTSTFDMTEGFSVALFDIAEFVPLSIALDLSVHTCAANHGLPSSAKIVSDTDHQVFHTYGHVKLLYLFVQPEGMGDHPQIIHSGIPSELCACDLIPDDELEEGWCVSKDVAPQSLRVVPSARRSTGPLGVFLGIVPVLMGVNTVVLTHSCSAENDSKEPVLMDP